MKSKNKGRQKHSTNLLSNKTEVLVVLIVIFIIYFLSDAGF